MTIARKLCTRDSSVGRAEDCSRESPDILRSAVRLRLAGKRVFSHPEFRHTEMCLLDCTLVCVLGHFP